MIANQRTKEILDHIQDEVSEFERYYYMYTETDQKDFKDHLLLVMENQFATINFLTQELSHYIRVDLIDRRNKVIDEK